MSDWLGYLNLLSALVILPLWRYVRNMRLNELRHLEERLERIEEKLDQHLRWHSEKS